MAPWDYGAREISRRRLYLTGLIIAPAFAQLDFLYPAAQMKQQGKIAEAMMETMSAAIEALVRSIAG